MVLMLVFRVLKPVMSRTRMLALEMRFVHYFLALREAPNRAHFPSKPWGCDTPGHGQGRNSENIKGA